MLQRGAYCWGKIFTSRDVEFHLFWHIVGDVLRKVFGERAVSSAVDLIWDPPACAGKATDCLEGPLSAWRQTLCPATQKRPGSGPSSLIFHHLLSFIASSCPHSSPPYPFLLKKKKNLFILFIWLCWILVGTCEYLVATCGILSQPRI